MFNLKFWDRAEKPPVPAEENKLETDLEETEKSALEEEQFKAEQEKAGPLDGLSLQEQAEALEKKRQEINDLQQKRREFYLQAKGLEDKMRSFGLSEEKQKEIREKIMAEGGKISEQIQEIRRDYGFEPTPVEVYSERLKMLAGEAERIREEAALDYRRAIDEVKQMVIRLENGTGSHEQTYHWLESIKKKNGEELLEIKDFLSSKFSYDSTQKELIAKLKELEASLSQKVEESIYKTEGDVKAARSRYQKVAELADMTELTLLEAKKNEGRFAPEK